MGIGLLAIFFTYSRRSGPVRPLVPQPRLSPLEFVDSLGGLYQRAHAASAAVGVAYQRFRYLLIKRVGLGSNASTKELNQALQQYTRVLRLSPRTQKEKTDGSSRQRS